MSKQSSLFAFLQRHIDAVNLGMKEGYERAKLFHFVLDRKVGGLQCVKKGRARARAREAAKSNSPPEK